MSVVSFTLNFMNPLGSPPDPLALATCVTGTHCPQGTTTVTGSLVPRAVPLPVMGAGLPGLIFASGGGLLAWCCRKRRAQAAA
jgi:hypothetical protein